MAKPRDPEKIPAVLRKIEQLYPMGFLTDAQYTFMKDQLHNEGVRITCSTIPTKDNGTRCTWTITIEKTIE